MSMFPENNTLIARLTQTMIRRSKMDWIEEEDTIHVQQINDRRAYWNGDLKVPITEDEAVLLDLPENTREVNFGVNYGQKVVDAKMRRLAPTGFRVDDVTGARREAVQQRFWLWWILNGMETNGRAAREVAARDGEVYIQVDWYYPPGDEEGLTGWPRFTVQEAWDGDQGTRVWKDESGAIVCVRKVTEVAPNPVNGLDAPMRLMDVWYPNRRESYVLGDNGQWEELYEVWVPDPLDPDREIPLWPIPWTDDNTPGGAPLGIPFIEAAPGSDLDRVKALNDEYNRKLFTLLVATDVEGIGFYFANQTGPKSQYISEEDPDAEPKRFRLHFARVQMIPGAGTISRVEGPDPGKLVITLDYVKGEISIVSEVPLHLLGAPERETTSGEHLKEREKPFVAMLGDLTVFWSRVHSDLFKYAARLHRKVHGPNGDVPAPESLIIGTNWQELEIRNEAVHVETVNAMEIPVRMKRELYGIFNAAQIAAMDKMDRREAAALAGLPDPGDDDDADVGDLGDQI